MHLNTSTGLLIFLAITMANIPFVNQRLLALIPLPWKKKPFKLRLAEWFLLYLLSGAIAHILEEQVGNVVEKKWELYVITLCLFLVFAFPGFVYQYLRRRK